MKTVKIGMAEYRAIKALSKKRGNLLQYLLNEAVRQYLKSQEEANSKEQAA